MKRFHLIFGLVVLAVFLLTGRHMHWFHQHLRYTPDGPRMLCRTRHIFILLSGLLHLGTLLHVVSGVKEKQVLQDLGPIFVF
jgi:hypothetical protein